MNFTILNSFIFFKKIWDFDWQTNN